MNRRPSTALVAAAAFGGLAVLTYLLAFHVDAVRARDAAAVLSLHRLEDTWPAELAEFTAELMNRPLYATWTTILLVVAWRLRGVRVAVVVGASVLLANVTTQILKPALAADRTAGVMPPGLVDPASWPSGHATAAMVLALGFILVLPPRARPFAAAAGGLLAVVVGWAVVVGTWHFPSDVIGGFSVAGAWIGLGLAILWRGEPARSRIDPAPSVALPAGLVALGLVATAAVGALRRPAAAADFAITGQSALVIGAVIGAFGLALAVALAAALRR